MLKGCLIGAGIAAGLFVTAIVAIVIMVSWQPDLSGVITPVKVSEMEASRVDSKIDLFNRQLADAPAGTLVSIELTQDEVTSKIDSILKANGSRVPLSAVTVNFMPGQVRVSGTLGSNGNGRSFIAQGTIRPNEGSLAVNISSLRMGLLPLPPGLIEGMLSQFAPGVDLAHLPLPIDRPADIKAVVIMNGVALLEATAK